METVRVDTRIVIHLPGLGHFQKIHLGLNLFSKGDSYYFAGDYNINFCLQVKRIFWWSEKKDVLTKNGEMIIEENHSNLSLEQLSELLIKDGWEHQKKG